MYLNKKFKLLSITNDINKYSILNNLNKINNTNVKVSLLEQSRLFFIVELNLENKFNIQELLNKMRETYKLDVCLVFYENVLLNITVDAFIENKKYIYCAYFINEVIQELICILDTMYLNLSRTLDHLNYIDGIIYEEIKKINTGLQKPPEEQNFVYEKT